MDTHRTLPSAATGARVLAVLVALCTTAACGPKGPVAPSTPSDDAAFAADPPPPRPGLDEGQDTGPDQIRAGDVLSLRNVGDKEGEAQTLIVDRGGFVHVALIGDLHLADMTVSQAEHAIQVAVSRYDKLGRVLLSVVDAKGRYATVTGAVDHAGNVPLTGEGRLADVLAASGGPRSTVVEDKMVTLGDLDGTRVVRAGQTLPVDARRALEGDPRHNIRLRPGDVVVVPPSLAARVIVLGQVGRPRTLTFRQGMRLTEVLADSGGLTQGADSADVRILRGGYAHPKLYVANARDVLAGRRSDPLLAAGDVVYVSQHWLATVGEVLEKVIPATTTALLIGTTVK
jgi:polysaccharide export outer membrane protein